MKQLLSLATLILAFTSYTQDEDEYAYSLEDALLRPERIKVLFISDHSKFPEKLLELTNLETLTLQNCSIAFPIGISALNKLSKLNINQCYSFPAGTHNIPHLKELNFSNNNFESINKEEATKLDIEKMNFNGLLNEHAYVPENWQLIHADSIEFSFFDDLEQLKDIIFSPEVSYLRIFQSPSSSLPEFFFQIKPLRTFVVEGIKITELVVSENYSLDTFILTGSNLACVPFEKLTMIRRVEVKGPKLNEDCRSRALSYPNVLIN
jgi:Leucine-rich repeat (LRR) protein